ncbi:UPF0764 protein C16orf89-like [Lutzomyia longipalpis]|uniref:UPF0764 protein C16orf89-like n=1 Tax=Lutzomyia longipalpis TaxID=7200 RepID=UPI002483A28B|nr:UPF0764 protein C16orf89-like [Lutzomyia longipalpis]
MRQSNEKYRKVSTAVTSQPSITMNFTLLLLAFFLNPLQISPGSPAEDVQHKLMHLLDFSLANPEILTPNAFFGINFADAITPQRVVKEKIQKVRKVFEEISRKNGWEVFDFAVDPTFWRKNSAKRREKLPAERLNVSEEVYENLLNIGSPDEEQSDECLRKLSRGKCSVSRKCWKVMSPNEEAFGYHQTHKLLFYMVLSRQRGCNFNPFNTQKIIRKLCTKILTEVLTIAHQGFPENFRDLAMEQIFLCSFEDFPDFLKPRWIAEISSWQDESGCFTLCESSRKCCSCSDHMTGVGAALLATFSSS